MKDDLTFNTDKGFPKWVSAGVSRVKSLGVLPILYTKHAKEEAEVDEVGGNLHPLPQTLDLRSAECVEVGVVVGRGTARLRKLQFRFPHPTRKGLDLTMPFALENGKLVAITVWANYKHDRHEGCNLSRYDSPDTPFPSGK